MIDITKQYRTRDGREVRIYCVDGGGIYPIHGALKGPGNDKWMLSKWTNDGEFLTKRKDSSDLVEVKSRIKTSVWANIFPTIKLFPRTEVTIYNTKEDADRCAGSTRIACVELKIDCEEGEGLDNE